MRAEQTQSKAISDRCFQLLGSVSQLKSYYCALQNVQYHRCTLADDKCPKSVGLGFHTQKTYFR